MKNAENSVHLFVFWGRESSVVFGRGRGGSEDGNRGEKIVLAEHDERGNLGKNNTCNKKGQCI